MSYFVALIKKPTTFDCSDAELPEMSSAIMRSTVELLVLILSTGTELLVEVDPKSFFPFPAIGLIDNAVKDPTIFENGALRS